jgi:3-keto-disaccharide hydrolase
MQRIQLIAVALLVTGVTLLSQSRQSTDGWSLLFDGKSLANFNTIGDANWQLVDGVVQANKGTGFLVTKNSYTDFQLRVEFWVDDDANSGVFLRCENPQMIDAMNAYEVNIYDKRPDQTYATGAIVDVVKPLKPMKAGGKWNTYEITAQGGHLTVMLNGTKTAETQNTAHSKAGPIGFQYGAGIVKFRSVQIRKL